MKEKDKIDFEQEVIDAYYDYKEYEDLEREDAIIATARLLLMKPSDVEKILIKNKIYEDKRIRAKKKKSRLKKVLNEVSDFHDFKSRVWIEGKKSLDYYGDLGDVLEEIFRDFTEEEIRNSRKEWAILFRGSVVAYIDFEEVLDALE